MLRGRAHHVGGTSSWASFTTNTSLQGLARRERGYEGAVGGLREPEGHGRAPCVHVVRVIAHAAEEVRVDDRLDAHVGLRVTLRVPPQRAAAGRPRHAAARPHHDPVHHHAAVILVATQEGLERAGPAAGAAEQQELVDVVKGDPAVARAQALDAPRDDVHLRGGAPVEAEREKGGRELSCERAPQRLAVAALVVSEVYVVHS